MHKEHSPKEKAIYRAVIELFEEGADLSSLTVSEITGRAGIGKGTAYEYFSDKEEMIAKALFYNIESYCEWLYQGLSKEKTLYDKMNYVLLNMEQQLTKTNCLIRLVHMMSDHSMMGKRIRELKEKRTSDEMVPMDMFRKMLKDEFTDAQPVSEKVMEYLVISIFSKILCYGMLLNEGKYGDDKERKVMRELICRGICREIEEM
ncbi:MAG: TetR/AcrR family transcriptional regulator [Suilimivivens sp.]